MLADDAIKAKAEQVRRYNEEYLRFYEPRGKQIAYHQSDAEIRLAIGPNQSGKSFSTAAEMLWAIGKVHPYRRNYIGPVYGRHCCATFQVMQSVIIPTYKRLAPRRPCLIHGRHWCGLKGGTWESAWSEEARTLTFADGSLLEFKSYDQDVLSYAGPPRHIIAHDEEPPQFLYTENLARQQTTGLNILFAFTPLNYSGWIYQLYEKSLVDPKIKSFKLSVYDNPLVTPETVAKIEAEIADPAERAARIYGEFTYITGRVWKEFGEHNWIEPFVIPNHWDKTLVIDPHPEKPTEAIVVVQNYDGIAYLCRHGQYHGDVEFVCNQITEELIGGWHINNWLIDPSSRQSATIRGKGRLIDEFRKYFPEIMEANNDVDLGREAVRALVKNRPVGPRLYVFRSCPLAFSQIQNYMWKPPLKSGEERGKPVAVKKNDEVPDMLRYYALHHHATDGGETFAGFNIGMVANG